MVNDLITDPHRKPWEWRLEDGAAVRVDALPLQRWLAVNCGRVWLTRSGVGSDDGADVWLDEGQRHPLPPGSEWVVEAWPRASIALLEAPQRAPRRGLVDRIVAALTPPRHAV